MKPFDKDALMIDDSNNGLSDAPADLGQVSGGPSPNGKWELFGSPISDRNRADEEESSRGSGGDDDESPKKKCLDFREKSVGDRMNMSLDDVIASGRRTPQKAPSNLTSPMRRKNATLEDFISPSRTPKSGHKGGFQKRNRGIELFGSSPPHKTSRPLDASFAEENALRRLVKEVCRALNEPKQALMRRVVNIAGKDLVSELLAEVVEVEARGGQLVCDGTRKRTKGGVFLNLLKGRVSKQDWDTIFQDEKEALKRRKAMKQRQRYASPGKGSGSDERAETQDVKMSTTALSYKDCLAKAM